MQLSMFEDPNKKLLNKAIKQLMEVNPEIRLYVEGEVEEIKLGTCGYSNYGEETALMDSGGLTIISEGQTIKVSKERVLSKIEELKTIRRISNDY